MIFITQNNIKAYIMIHIPLLQISAKLSDRLTMSYAICNIRSQSVFVSSKDKGIKLSNCKCLITSFAASRYLAPTYFFLIFYMLDLIFQCSLPIETSTSW